MTPSVGQAHYFFRGLRTSSPWQLGQTQFIVFAHFSQNVHS